MLVAEQGYPIVRRGLNASKLERTVSGAFTAFKDAGVVPKDKEIEISLHRIGAVKGVTGVQERFEQAIQRFRDAVGVAGGVENTHELRSERVQGAPNRQSKRRGGEPRHRHAPASGCDRRSIFAGETSAERRCVQKPGTARGLATAVAVLPATWQGLPEAKSKRSAAIFRGS